MSCPSKNGSEDDCDLKISSKDKIICRKFDTSDVVSQNIAGLPGFVVHNVLASVPWTYRNAYDAYLPALPRFGSLVECDSADSKPAPRASAYGSLVNAGCDGSV